MAGAILRNTLAGPADEEANPWDALLAEQMERMKSRTRAPMYTPEQIAQRRDDANEEHDMGLLGMLSGHEGMQQAGGQIFRQALANRQPRISERGVADPITGEFTYDPDFLDQREESRLDAIQKLKVAADLKRDADRKEREFRLDLKRTVAGGAGGGGQLGGGVAPQIGSTQTGSPIFRDKQGRLFTYDEQGNPIAHQGPVGPRASSGQPSEDERKAAGWVAQAENAMKNAFKVVATDKEATRPGIVEKGLGFIPGIGEDLANMARSPARQKFVQAAASFSEAALRAATGAGVNEGEARQKIAELTPQWGDDIETQAQKLAGWRIYLGSLKTRAGRALPQGAGGGTDEADPLGMRGGK
jgi:hypothetical protein